MDLVDYKNNGKEERAHFWYDARIALLEKILKTILNNRKNTILNLGCGTGTEMFALRKYGEVVGLEKNSEAAQICREKGYEIIEGDLEEIRLPDKKFNVICAFDVLEHLKNDILVIRKINNALKPNGFFIFTLPANKKIFGPHDLSLDHKRRYDKKELLSKLKLSGFTDIEFYYWNTLLYPIEVVYRLIRKSLSTSCEKPKSDAFLLPHWINIFLKNILKIEAKIFFRRKTTPGLTIYGWAKIMD